MKEKIVIMLVEDSAAYRKVIQRALGDEPYVKEILHFGTAEVALRSLNSRTRVEPDVILLDLSLPGMSGLEAIPLFRETLDDARIIILTQSADEKDVVRAVSEGASGYLLKSSTAIQVKEAIEAVTCGGAALDDRISKYVLEALRDRSAHMPSGAPNRDLSEREMETLRLLGEGLSRKEIAERLGVGNTTVVTYLNRIYLKLDVPNAPAAISKAYQTGLL